MESDETPPLSEVLDRIARRAPYYARFKPRPVDVARLRQRLRMTQGQFAARFGLPVATLRHWEHGDRDPRGPALVLLNLIQYNPRAAMQLLPPSRGRERVGPKPLFRKIIPMDHK